MLAIDTRRFAAGRARAGKIIVLQATPGTHQMAAGRGWLVLLVCFQTALLLDSEPGSAAWRERLTWV